MYNTNKIGRLLPVAIYSALFLGVAQFASAQSTASTSAYGRAMIVSAIGISKNHDLLFGQIVSDAVGGTVSVAVDGTRTSSGPTLLDQTGSAYSTFHQASFAITGQPGYIYTITVPSSAVTITSGTGSSAPTMTIDTFVTNGTSGVRTLDGTLGTDTLAVGGTLHIAASQTAGSYSGSFNVTVAYQ